MLQSGLVVALWRLLIHRKLGEVMRGRPFTQAIASYEVSAAVQRIRLYCLIERPLVACGVTC